MHHILLIGLLLSSASGLAGTDSGTRATMRVRGNIRFGPTTEAMVVTTLDAGTPVRILGQVEGRAGWYEIAFPEQGGAWIHGRNIEVVGDGRQVRVTSDIANIRSDSRIQGELVAQVREGEVLRWHGREQDGRWQGITHGAWHKVHPARAVAYAFESVLSFTDDQGTATAARPPRDHRLETVWQDTVQLYERYRQALERDPQGALGLDWGELARRLQAVVDGHPEFRTRLVADDLRSRIGRVVWIAERHQREQGIRPRLEIPELTGAAPQDQQDQAQPRPGRQEQVIARVSPPRDPEPPPPTTTRDPEPLQLDPVPTPPQAGPETSPEPVTRPEPDISEDDPVTVTTPDSAPDEHMPQLPAIATDRYQAVGWLQSRDIVGSDARHVIIDRNNDIEALVVVTEGSDIRLADFHWRRVGVQGDTDTATVTIDGREMVLPLITVTTMQLAQ